MIFEKQVLGAYRGMIYSRCDDTGDVYYFSHEDFFGLEAERISFRARAGHTLRGYIYSYGAPIKDRLVVFDHGFGGGHRSYMKEIELLCRHGYTVLSYDHTGCMESEGEGAGGLSQSLSDLNDCLDFIKGEKRFYGYDISVMGHSWGGFSTMNICAYHPEVSRVVVLSGFISVERQIATFFAGLMKPYRKAVFAEEKRTNPIFSLSDGIKALSDTETRALLIYSDNDNLCTKRQQYDPLLEALGRRENVKLVLVSGKGHNPNYTKDAVEYKDAFFAELKKRRKRGLLKTDEEKREFVKSYDWDRMTAQDEDVWATVFEFLDAEK